MPDTGSTLANCSEAVKSYLKTEFGKLLSKQGIEEWIDCHVDFVSPPKQKIPQGKSDNENMSSAYGILRTLASYF
jgi:hypothetical protein